MPDGATWGTNSKEIGELEAAVKETQAVTVPDKVALALKQELGPVALRLPLYRQKTETLPVRNQAEADAATLVCNQIADDIKLVEGNEVLTKIVGGLDHLHKRWVAIQKALLVMKDYRRSIKTRIMSWQEAERVKAEAEQRRLQAEADARARKQQEALLAKAAAMKTAEKQEQYRAQAESVVAPTVVVQAPKAAMKSSKRWVVAKIDVDVFIEAAGKDPSLRGYIEVKTGGMERGKAANPSLVIPGVVFEQKLV